MDKKIVNIGQSAGKALNNIPQKLGCYLSGFADGEGSLNISLIKRSDYRNNWKVVVAFNISQKDNSIPLIYKKLFKCGTIRYRSDGICYFEVTNINDIRKTVIPFFDKFPLLSKSKKITYQIWKKVADIVIERKHLNKAGMKKILKLRDMIKVGRKRKYTNKEIMQYY